MKLHPRGVCLLATSAFLLAGTARPAEIPPAPVAAKKPVTDTYHGVQVTDDYQWMEKADDPEVKAWVAAENKRTRAYLDALPDRAPIEKRLTELFSKVSPSYASLVSRPGILFALKFQPPKQQPMLVTLTSAMDIGSEKVLIDPNALDPKGKTTIDWYVPSLDGKQVAVSISENGSEDGTLYIYNTATGERLPDKIPHIQYPTAGGSAAWQADGKALYYTRFPRTGERPEADLNFYQQIYRHVVGDPDSKDVYVLGKDFPKIAEVHLETSADGRYTLASVGNGDGGEYAHYLLDASAETPAWRQITKFSDRVKQVAIGRDHALYLQSVLDAPRGKVLRIKLDAPSAELKDASVIVPESEAVIQSLDPAGAHLYVTELLGGPSRLMRFDLDGSNPQEVPLPPVSAVQEADPLRDKGPADDRLLFRQTSYTTPFAWYLYDPATNSEKITALVGTSPVDYSDIEAVREFATSKDGTKVPINILRRKGTKLDGSNPVLLGGYGGYGISLSPRFSFTYRLWFDRGGVAVIANLRGGGEYGEAWHKAGNLTHKQTVFDDFYACANYLVKAGYTNPGKLATEGGSNGGLLMGAFLTQHPDAARAVVSHVGIYDMLRVELDPNGLFNTTEFGSVKDPEQFQALYAYSPYHHVQDGVKYPAVFFLTGDNDGRVNPANSRKMTARLQAANASSYPILLRTTSAAGHGIGTALTEQIAQQSDVFAFLFDQLGMK
jgi:prolyl oligopeptidase